MLRITKLCLYFLSSFKGPLLLESDGSIRFDTLAETVDETLPVPEREAHSMS